MVNWTGQGLLSKTFGVNLRTEVGTRSSGRSEPRNMSKFVTQIPNSEVKVLEIATENIHFKVQISVVFSRLKASKIQDFWCRPPYFREIPAVLLS